jgi:hypothetical protein
MKFSRKNAAGSAVADTVRIAAEMLAVKALVDPRIPDGERLVRAMRARPAPDDPDACAYAKDVLGRYAAVIAQRTGGDARSVKQHFLELIGAEQAARLGVKIHRLGIAGRTAADGAVLFTVALNDQGICAIADYLASPTHLNLGGLPLDPFGSPKVRDLMILLKYQHEQWKWAPESRHNVLGVPSASQRQAQVGESIGAVLAELSATMPDAASRQSALRAMRLDNCLEARGTGLWMLDAPYQVAARLLNLYT